MISIREIADRHFGTYKIKGNELIPILCPFCGGGDHKDKETFSINLNTGQYLCHRGSCAVRGNQLSLCRHYGYPINDKISSVFRKEYKKPQIKYIKPKTEIEKYFESRKISKSTLDYAGVGEHNGNIVFHFYDTENNLVFNKFKLPREPKIIDGKKEAKSWREAGGKPILYLMNKCEFELPLTITEGEIDALTLIECGIKNVVSLPSGTNDFTWIDLCWDWIDNFQKIIIWTDNDESGAGQECAKKIVEKLGDWRCLIVKSKYKDANEMLQKTDKDTVLKTWESAEEIKNKNIISLADVQYDDYSRNAIKSGFSGLDKLTGGWRFGEVSIWTGETGSGKSTFINQALLNLVNENQKCCIYSGELPKAFFKFITLIQASGERNLKKEFNYLKNEEVYRPKFEVVKKINEWIADKMFLADFDGKLPTPSDLFKTFLYAYKRYDCKIFVIDNLMKIKFPNINENAERSDFGGELMAFAQKYNVIIWLVAHPRKTENGKINVMDIKGTSDLPNMCNNLFCVSRVNEKQKEKFLNAENYIEILKDRFGGVKNKIVLYDFNINDRRFNELNNSDLILYNWQESEEKQIIENEKILEEIPF